MTLISNLLIGLSGLIHSYFLWFQMFDWEQSGPRNFSSLPAEVFPLSVEMAANQGLYNGFLAAGLFWSLTIRDQTWKRKVAVLFLIFVAIAGVYGTYSVTINALIAQTIPALLALIALHFSAQSKA